MDYDYPALPKYRRHSTLAKWIPPFLLFISCAFYGAQAYEIEILRVFYGASQMANKIFLFMYVA
jgi:hypothetical protein